jgi:N-acetylated-alpha-linked acidic dipeptidase
MKTSGDMRQAVEKHNMMLAKNAFKLAADPTKPFTNPSRKEVVPYLDFSPVQNALATLKSNIETLKNEDFTKLSEEKLRTLNGKLMKMEQALTDESGLPRRSWFKHRIYAPGFYTGYGVKTLPGVREAIEQKNWKEASVEIGKLAKTLEAFNTRITELHDLKST